MVQSALLNRTTSAASVPDGISTSSKFELLLVVLKLSIWCTNGFEQCLFFKSTLSWNCTLPPFAVESAWGSPQIRSLVVRGVTICWIERLVLLLDQMGSVHFEFACAQPILWISNRSIDPRSKHRLFSSPRLKLYVHSILFDEEPARWIHQT